MLDDKQVEALHSGCITCGKPFSDGHRIAAVYDVFNLYAFAHQVELGIAGPAARNYWSHVDCDNHRLIGYDMTPDIGHCIKCRQHLKKKEFIRPTYLVVDPQAVNPSDPTDRGIALNDRVYFIHVDCGDPTMSRNTRSPIIKP